MSSRAFLRACRLAGLLPYRYDPERRRYLASPLWRVYSVVVELTLYVMLLYIAVPKAILDSAFSTSEFLSKTSAILNVNLSLLGGILVVYCVTRQHSELLALLNGVSAEQRCASARVECGVALWQGFMTLGDLVRVSVHNDYLRSPRSYFAYFLVRDVLCLSMSINHILFSYLVRCVLRRYQELNREISKTIAMKRNAGRFRDLSGRIAGYRLQHQNLREFLAKICHCFGPQAAMYLLLGLSFVVSSSSLILPILYGKNATVNHMMFAFLYTLLMFLVPSVISITSCNSACEEGNRTAELCRDFLDIDELGEREEEEVNQLIASISMNPIRCQLIGVISVDNSMFISGLSTVISYLVVMLQFESSSSEDGSCKSNTTMSEGRNDSRGPSNIP